MFFHRTQCTFIRFGREKLKGNDGPSLRRSVRRFDFGFAVNGTADLRQGWGFGHAGGLSGRPFRCMNVADELHLEGELWQRHRQIQVLS